MKTTVATLCALMMLVSAAPAWAQETLSADDDELVTLPEDSETHDDEVELELDDQPKDIEPDRHAPPPDGTPKYILEPGTKQVLSWVLIGTGGALLVTGISLYIAHLAVAAPLADLREELERNPDSSDAQEADYLERKQTADLLYIFSIVANATGLVTAVGGLTLFLLPQEVFEEKAPPQE